ncbi:MAG: CsbD family protein [Acidimicrobiales bacterium]
MNLLLIIILILLLCWRRLGLRPTLGSLTALTCPLARCTASGVGETEKIPRAGTAFGRPRSLGVGGQVGGPYFRVAASAGLSKGEHMGTQDKASNSAQDIKGKIKEKVGEATSDENLEDEGKADQAESAVRDVGEKVKDAASKIKHALTDD